MLGWEIINNSSRKRSFERAKMKLKGIAGQLSQPEAPPAPQLQKSQPPLFAPSMWEVALFAPKHQSHWDCLAAPMPLGSALQQPDH